LELLNFKYTPGASHPDFLNILLLLQLSVNLQQIANVSEYFQLKQIVVSVNVFIILPDFLLIMLPGLVIQSLSNR
jgi:hypothetical protein